MNTFAALASTSVLLLGSLLFHPYLGPSSDWAGNLKMYADATLQ